ncbi:MAG TPA: hypothetical protein VGG34_03920 [Opitutaceae bacterium]|jgi:hypothetical protein
MSSQLIFFAAAQTTLDKLKAIPPAFWGKVGLAIAAVIIVFILIQRVLKINKFVLAGATFIGGGLLFFNWVYYRTEPKILTPVIEKIAPFFPTAGAYQTKQTTQTPGQSKK